MPYRTAPLTALIPPAWIINTDIGLPANVDLLFTQGQYWANAPATVTSLLSCTRASSGYVQNGDGTLTSFGSNTLRIGVSTGLLPEESRTNITLQSNSLNTTWLTQGTTNANNVTAAPDGTVTASSITTAVSSIGTYQNFIAGAAISSWSIYAKAGPWQYVFLTVGSVTGNSATAVFDLSAGVMSQSLAQGTFTIVSTSIQALANNWFRCSLVSNQGGGTTYNGYSEVGQANASTGNSFNSFGEIISSAASNVSYFWGAQFESGNLASSPITTTTTSVTRAADVITTSGVLTSALSQPAGSIFTSSPGISQLAGGGFPELMANGNNQLYFQATNQVFFVNASVNATVIANFSNPIKVACAWDSSSIKVTANGQTPNTQTPGMTMSGTFSIGATNAASFFLDGYMTRFAVWTSKLSDTTIQNLTV